MLKKENVAVNVQVSGWEEAIRKAGSYLVASQSCNENYVNDMVDAVHALGPYIVVAPGIAFAHARPSDDVYHSDISAILLRESVAFGHEENDPVKLVFAFGARNKDEHIGALIQLGESLSDERTVEQLFQAPTPEAFLLLINASTEVEK